MIQFRVSIPVDSCGSASGRTRHSVGLPVELKSLLPAKVQQIIDQANNTASAGFEHSLKPLWEGRQVIIHGTLPADFLGENRPSRDQLFQAGTRVELNQTLTEREPVIHSLLNDAIGNIHYRNNRATLIGELPCFAKGVIQWTAEEKRAGFEVRGETIFPCLTAGLLELWIRSVFQDLLRTSSGCTMQ